MLPYYHIFTANEAISNGNKTSLFLKVMFFIFAFYYTSNIKAYTTIVKTGDSDTFAKNELIKVFQQGGKITFEEGNWNINLNSSQAKVKADVIIEGANLLGADLNLMGAYEGTSTEKTKITFSGSIIDLTTTCTKFTLKNLTWIKTGIKSANFHIPEVDFSNVTIDISTWNVGRWGKRNLKVLDGLSGSIEHVTFRGFFQAVAFQRNIKKGAYPFTKSGKLIFNRCLFDPDPTIIDNNLAGVTYDSGNDEYAALLDLEGTEIKNSHFIDCRIAISKCSNLVISGNLFDYRNSNKEPLHLEEFSRDILISNNTFKYSGTKTFRAIDIGAVQTSTDITITNNIVEQTNQLSHFVIGSGAKNITINNNEIKNHRNLKYVTLWGCGSKNIQVGTNGVSQPGLASANLDIRSQDCSRPHADGTFYIIWNDTEYLGLVNGDVKLVTYTTPPIENSFKWKLTLDNISRLENYYTIQNQNGSNFYLEVLKGPTQPERIGKEGQPYLLFGEKVYAKAVGSYSGINREPGFGIYAKNGKYALLPGGNERKSEIIKDEDNVSVYMLESDEDNAHYNWTFSPATVLSLTKFETELSKIYPNPTSGNIYIPETLHSEKWSIYDVLGRKIIETSDTTIINLTKYPKGLYLLKSETGLIKKIIKK